MIRMSKKLKVLLIVAALSLVAAFIAVFIIANNFFMDRFPVQSTIIGGTEVSGMTVSEAVVAMNASEGLKMTVNKDGVEHNIPIASSVVRMFDGDQVRQAKKEISFFSYLFHTPVEHALHPESVNIDEKKLRQAIETTIPEPKYSTSDAYFDTDWNLIAEVQGDDINYDDFLKRVKSDIENGEELSYDASEFYFHPSVRADDEDMQKVQDKVKKYKAMSITFTFGEKRKEVITSEMICSNLVLKKGKLKLKTGWVDDFVRRLEKKYNTLGSTRTFKTTMDGEKQV